MKKIYLLFFLFLAAINFNLILKPLSIVVGGTQGLALMINKNTHISNSLIILVINIIMLLISYFKLNKEVFKSIILSSFFYPFFIKITSCLTIYINKYVLIVISGLLSGISGGFILKLGYSTGGINVLVILFKKYLNIKESISNFIINLIIILLGSYYFGIINTLYALIIIIINSIVVHIIVK